MGKLGRYKRRRQSTTQHGCNNGDGQGNPLEACSEPQHPKKATTFSAPTVEQEQPTEISLMKPSILRPKNSAAQSILKSISTDPPKKIVASIIPLSSVHQNVVEFTEEQLPYFLAFLGREKTALRCGQGTVCPSNPATGTTTTSTTSSDSTDEATTTNSASRSLPLHWNNKYIDFEKLLEFNINFGSFPYKINEFGTKTE
jgi:hypothetical protein